jgi:hypothetical protein
MLIDIFARPEFISCQQLKPSKWKTYRIVVNVVLVETADFVVFLNVFALGATTLLQCIQQFPFDATKTWKGEK